LETRAAHIAVGAFVLALVAGIVVFVVWISKFQQDNVVFFDIRFTGSVTGLVPGNPVRYRGILVGRVSDIRIDPDNAMLILVTIEVTEGTPVRTDSVASLEISGIAGVTYVQISGGSSDSAMLPQKTERPFPEIASKPSKLEQLFEGAPALVGRLNELADKFAELLSEKNVQSITDTLIHLETITSGLAGQAGGLGDLMREGADAAEQIRSTSIEFELLAQDLRSQVTAIGGAAEGAIADLEGTARSFSAVAAQLEAVLRENRTSFRDFSTYGLYEATQLMTELRLLVATLSRVSAQIERDPARFFFGDRALGVQAE
jgi:phospholipid/cholesterol/gamma-HCH transport system substrate-binding protein